MQKKNYQKNLTIYYKRGKAMKKLFILMSAIFILSPTSTAFAIEKCGNCALPPTKQEIEARRAQREAAFEQRLQLTEEQKIKARELRKQGFEKIKPVIDEIKAKKQEMEMVKRSRIAVQAQEEQLAKLDEELKILEKKAHEIRKANMKEFESILTKDQKKILKQMKQEGRNRYKQNHPNK